MHFGPKIPSLVGLLCVFMLSDFAQAQVVGPTYPAPGGNTFAAGTYSNFDTSQFSKLYWGSSSLVSPAAGLDGTLHTLTFGSIVGNTTTWFGTTNWTDTRNGANVFHSGVQIELQVAVTGLGSTPWLDVSSVSGFVTDAARAGVGAVIDDSAGLSFTRSLQWTLASALPGYAVNTPLSQIQVGPSPNQFVSSFAGGFYSTAPVPEPSGYALGLAGFGVLGIAARRRKSARPMVIG